MYVANNLIIFLVVQTELATGTPVNVLGYYGVFYYSISER